MRAIAYHPNFALADGTVIAPGPAEQRVAARAVLAVARPFELLAFRVSDDHVHLVLPGDDGAAAEAVRRVKIALQRSLDLGGGFGPAHLAPILDHRHLDRAFRYVLRQAARHGFSHDPWAEASNLPDLLGMRLLGDWTVPLVRRHLPRVGRPGLLAALGVDGLAEGAVGLDELREAVLAAAALMDLAGRSAEVVEARHAAVHAVEPGAPAAALAAALETSERTVSRLRSRAPQQERLVRAVRRQADVRRRRRVDPWVVEDVACGLAGPWRDRGEESEVP